MSKLKLHDVGGYLAFDERECREFGAALNQQFTNASPFPSIVIDELLDERLLKDVAHSFPSSQGKYFFNRDQERLKYQYQPSESESPLVRNLLAELNGRAFIGFLEEMTGIKGLISDPYFSGGGLHEIKRGGHLGVHADFNVHPDMKVQRRLNLLIYLNEDWSEEYGGKLELWDRKMNACEVKIAPVLGRAVVFATDLDSFHGHPDPITCPEDRSRRSIATYYYTALTGGLDSVPDRTTNFRVRPGSNDQPDRHIQRDHFFKDWMPPKLYRFLRRSRNRAQ